MSRMIWVMVLACVPAVWVLAQGAGTPGKPADGPAVLVPPATGAASQPASSPASKPAGQFVSAKVNMERNAAGKVVNRVITIEDEATLKKLVAFFPLLGNKLKIARAPGAWIADVIIEFIRADGSVLEVTATYGDGRWAEANKGDYALKDGLGKFLDELPAK